MNIKIYLLLIFAFLYGCKGCPQEKIEYATFVNQTMNVVEITFRRKGRTYDEWREISINPGAVVDILVERRTVYHTGKAFASPEALCRESDDDIIYRNNLSYASNDLARLTICEPNSRLDPKLYPIEIHELGYECEFGFTRAELMEPMAADPGRNSE